MKPYYLKNAGEYHSRLTSKLAVLLLALPVCGAFAADPVYNSTLSDATHLGVNTVTANTLSGAVVTAAGTATALNTNYIGWSAAATAQVALYWDTGAVALAAGTSAPMVIGGTTADAATASSSYNTLTIDDYVNLTGVTTLSIGVGALDAGKVDADILGAHNALSISGAGVTNAGAMIKTTLTTTGAVTLGTNGSSNTISITSGANLTSAGALTVGAGVSTDATAGSSNEITVSGKVTATLIGTTLTSESKLTAVGATVGNYGSSNKITVSDGGALVLGTGSLEIGAYGDSNSVSVTDGTLTLAGTVSLGVNQGADSNKLTLSKTALATSGGLTAGALTVGSVGSSNELTLTNTASVFVSAVNVGIGDTSPDGTTGLYTTADGNSNKLTATDSVVKTAGAVKIGDYGSKNVVTLTNSGLYAAAADGADEGSAIDVLTEVTTGVASITVGTGVVSDETHDQSALGSSNSLTFAGASIFKSEGSVVVGGNGSSNTLALTGASIGGISGNLSIGLVGSSNTLSLSGKSSVALTGGLILGQNGSSNKLTVEGGSSLTVDGAVTNFGTGVDTTSASALQTALGSSNVVTVDGKGSTLTLKSATDFVIGSFGSNNKLVASNESTVVIKSGVTLGEKASANLGTILTPVRYFSNGNQINISGGASVSFSAADTLKVGALGNNNSVSVMGENSLLDITLGSVIIGEGSADAAAYGSNNSFTVSSGAVVIADSIYIGSSGTSYSGSNNSLTVSNGAIVVANTFFAINEDKGDGNRLYLNDGMMAFKGKYVAGSTTWEDYIVTGDNLVTSPSLPKESLTEQGLIKVWDTKTSAYVTAKASDLKVTYYSSETEAEKATGYKGLAGYSVLTVATTNRLGWAGNVYDAGNGSYCSDWYGWFYNDAAYGDFIMSYNNYSWQYVTPSSTPDSTWIYDYSLASWIYTDQTYFQNNWVYNYAKSEWQQLGK
jgi:hypothetical protein